MLEHLQVLKQVSQYQAFYKVKYFTIMYSLSENKLGNSGVKVLVEGVINLKCSSLITLEYVDQLEN